MHKSRRVSRNYVYNSVCNNAERLGLHNPDGVLIEKFTPHCCRHWFTTHLRRAGMSREFRQALRGDVVKDAVDIYDHIDLEELTEDIPLYLPWIQVDIYDHIDLEELRREYLDKIPLLKPALLCHTDVVDLRQPGRQTVGMYY